MVEASLEDRVNSLNERYDGNMTDYREVRGSEMCTHIAPGSLGALTQWKVVMPLEYKMHVLTMTKLEHDRKQRSNNNNAAGVQVPDQRPSFDELNQW